MSTEKAKLVITNAEFFYDEIKSINNHRYKSWEHCYECFYNARKNGKRNLDYLSLQLSFYLASWGMYRGSSFLLQRDYQIHIPIIEEILKPDYDELLSLECKTLFSNKEIQEKLKELSSNLEERYREVRNQVSNPEIKQPVSNILITKVLLGTLGCVPAYDRFFVDAVKAKNITTGNYNNDSICKLAEFYVRNEPIFENKRKEFKVGDLIYPQMKLLDMGLWQIGFERAEKKINEEKMTLSKDKQ